MAAALPVWPTTKTILAHAWQERSLVVRYATLPLVVLFLIDLGGLIAGIDIEKNVIWQIVTSLLALVAYAPFTVTWFQSIAFDEGTARTRPMFVIADLEKNVILANIRVLAFLIVFTLVIVIVVGGAAYGVRLVAPKLMEAAAFIIAPVAVFYWVMALTRVSVVIAYGAAGEPMGLREAFQLTRPIAYRLTWIHIILATMALVIALPLPLVADSESATNLAANIGLTVLSTISEIVYLILATALFAVAYRRLKETHSTRCN